ncbi:MAG: sugar phosphate isomerase/epimerase family protein [Phycisphaerales bacterium JB038]
MRIGINMLLWTGQVTEAHRPTLEMIKTLGYDLVEIPVMSGAVAHYADVGRWLEDLGLSRTTSMAFTDPAADPISPDPDVRRAALEQLHWQIDCAHAMGAAKVIGPMFQVLGQFTGTGPTDDELRWAAELLRAAASRAEGSGVTLAIEPLNRFECHLCCTLESARAWSRDVDHPSVGVMVDTFHANIEEKDTAEAIRSAGEWIRHVHISDNDRGTPGAGQIDFGAVVRALDSIGYDGDLVVEAFGRATPELAAATRVWRDTFESAEQLARDAIEFLSKWL